MPEPRYLLLNRSELQTRVEAARAALHDCRLCGWDCSIDRAHDLGPCRTGTEVRVATAYIHHGEERPLVLGGGSGAIFFANCDLRCQFCQTARWNIKGNGTLVSTRQLAAIMLDLQAKGAANINLVTPTHVAPQILEALHFAVADGLTLPLVWNSGGYDAPQLLAFLDGVVDVYLPDMKYGDAGLGLSFSGVHDYPVVNRRAVREMHRQVGDLNLDAEGRVRRGLLIRHLVMPGQIEDTRRILEWIAEELGTNTYLSLMDQYRPAFRASARPDIGRPLTDHEYMTARDIAIELGLTRLDNSLTLVNTTSATMT